MTYLGLTHFGHVDVRFSTPAWRNRVLEYNTSILYCFHKHKCLLYANVPDSHWRGGNWKFPRFTVQLLARALFFTESMLFTPCQQVLLVLPISSDNSVFWWVTTHVGRPHFLIGLWTKGCFIPIQFPDIGLNSVNREHLTSFTSITTVVLPTVYSCPVSLPVFLFSMAQFFHNVSWCQAHKSISCAFLFTTLYLSTAQGSHELQPVLPTLFNNQFWI